MLGSTLRIHNELLKVGVCWLQGWNRFRVVDKEKSCGSWKHCVLIFDVSRAQRLEGFNLLCNICSSYWFRFLIQKWLLLPLMKFAEEDYQAFPIGRVEVIPFAENYPVRLHRKTDSAQIEFSIRNFPFCDFPRGRRNFAVQLCRGRLKIRIAKRIETLPRFSLQETAF